MAWRARFLERKESKPRERAKEIFVKTEKLDLFYDPRAAKKPFANRLNRLSLDHKINQVFPF
jgi:hypothetical protein